jgi:hypothetical protein
MVSRDVVVYLNPSYSKFDSQHYHSFGTFYIPILLNYYHFCVQFHHVYEDLVFFLGYFFQFSGEGGMDGEFFGSEGQNHCEAKWERNSPLIGSFMFYLIFRHTSYL